MTPARRGTLALTILAVGFAVAGCEQLRDNYDKVTLGMTPKKVEEILGAPTYRSDDVWVWTSESPKNWTKISVAFEPDDEETAEARVAGKRWVDPEKPRTNEEIGHVP